MRQDARSLLERLGRTDFRYQEFEDPFADMELWPIFEALLKDENIVGHQAPALENAEIQLRTLKRADSNDGLGARLGGTDHSDAAHDPSAPEINLRQFFSRFAEGQ